MFSFFYPAIKEYVEVKKYFATIYSSKMNKILHINMGLYDIPKLYHSYMN